jgi:hypothetical protein
LPPYIETASDFPSLTTPETAEKAVGESKDSEEDSAGSSAETANEKPETVESGQSWAAIATKETVEPRRSFISMVSDEAWDATSYCSDDGHDLGENPEAGVRVEEVEGIIV